MSHPRQGQPGGEGGPALRHAAQHAVPFVAGVAVATLYFSVLQSPVDTPSLAAPEAGAGSRLGKFLGDPRVPAPSAVPARSTLAVRSALAEDPEGQGWWVTDSGEVCFKLAYNLTGVHSDWHNLKWVPPVAPCTVKGLPIEALDTAFNFRRGFAMGYTGDVDDRTHVLPFLRAAHDPILSTRPRRVLLDLGGNAFHSSVLWFLKMYPMEFTEIYVFESAPGVFKLPAKAAVDTCQAEAVVALNGASSVQNPDCKLMPNEVLERIQLREQYVGTTDNLASSPQQVDITRLIKSELNLTRHDTLIVKMDVEKAEWSILPEWIKDDEMSSIVDEVFVEVHYKDPTMHDFGWDTCDRSREEASKLFEDLRSRGFYAHSWP